MKKRIICTAFIVIAVLVVLFVPFSVRALDDGGTVILNSLSYTIVKWDTFTEQGKPYKSTSVYWFKNKSTSADELWEREQLLMEKSFRATVIELNGNIAIVEPIAGEDEASSANRISISTDKLKSAEVLVGDVVEVVYKGLIRETYPATLDVVSWRLTKNLSHLEYTDTFLDKSSAEVYREGEFSVGDVIITEIYSNCFFAEPVIPMPHTIKFNGKLPDGFCVGDQIEVTHGVSYYNGYDKMETDMISVKSGTFVPDPDMCYKPVIYLYPEKQTQLSVRLSLNGSLSCTYPAYNNGWNVLANPDSTLIDEKGQSYNYLYWEGDVYAEYDMSRGFCVRGEDTAEFLEIALDKLGLTRREANEFIVYWLPLMQNNPYNLISFQGKEYTDNAVLEISQTPDTLIRVFMVWKPLTEYIEIAPQELDAPERNGFVVVEWGGAKIEN